MATLTNHTQTRVVDTTVLPHTHVQRDGHIKRTDNSYSREDIPELNNPPIGHTTTKRSPSTQNTNNWILSVPIPIPPDLPNPTLRSLIYNVHYTAFGIGYAYAYVQTDVIISNGVEIDKGIITDATELFLYSHYDEGTGHTEGYTPPTLNETVCSRLCSKPSFQGADTSGRCDYVDSQEIYLNTRIGDGDHDIGQSPIDSCYLNLFFHVYESSRSGVLRSIEANVIATWKDNDDEEGSERRVIGSEIEEIKKEREKLTMVKNEAEVMVKQLEEKMKKTIEEAENKRKKLEEWQETIEERVYKRIKKAEASRMDDEASIWAKRRNDMKVAAENAIVKMVVERDNFHKEVREYEEQDAKNKKGMEAERKEWMDVESKRRLEAERNARVEEDKVRKEEIAEIQRKVCEGIEQYRREEVENRKSQEMERIEVERRAMVEIQRMVKEEFEKERLEYKAKQEEENTEKYKAHHTEVDEEGGRGKVEGRAQDSPRKIDSATEVVLEKELQEHIKELAQSKGINCSEGYAWVKTRGGYICKNDRRNHLSHFVSFEELGLE